MAKRHGDGRDDDSPPGVFALHVGSFALYNVIVAYFLREQLALSAWGLAV